MSGIFTSFSYHIIGSICSNASRFKQRLANQSVFVTKDWKILIMSHFQDGSSRWPANAMSLTRHHPALSSETSRV